MSGAPGFEPRKRRAVAGAAPAVDGGGSDAVISASVLPDEDGRIEANEAVLDDDNDDGAVGGGFQGVRKAAGRGGAAVAHVSSLLSDNGTPAGVLLPAGVVGDDDGNGGQTWAAQPVVIGLPSLADGAVKGRDIEGDT